MMTARFSRASPLAHIKCRRAVTASLLRFLPAKCQHARTGGVIFAPPTALETDADKFHSHRLSPILFLLSAQAAGARLMIAPHFSLMACAADMRVGLHRRPVAATPKMFSLQKILFISFMNRNIFVSRVTTFLSLLSFLSPEGLIEIFISCHCADTPEDCFDAEDIGDAIAATYRRRVGQAVRLSLTVIASRRQPRRTSFSTEAVVATPLALHAL